MKKKVKKDPLDNFFKKFFTGIPKIIKGIFKALYKFLELILNFAYKVIKIVFLFTAGFSCIVLMFILVTAISVKLIFSAFGITESQKWHEFIDQQVAWMMEENHREELEGKVKRALAKKHDMSTHNFRVFVSDEAENHLRGNIIPKTDQEVGGGIFLATKIYGKWEIVFEGNGAISCEEMEAYDFPQEMIEDCS